MVALEGRWEEKKEEKLLSEWYMYQRGWLKSFFHFHFSFFIFGFWFLVFYCRVTRVARGVLWALGWGYIQHGESFFLPSTGLHYRYMLPFFIDEMEGYGRAGGRRQDAFLLEIENRQKSATVGLGGFFVFMRLVGW